MKKLLSILAAVGLTATASTAVVACTTTVKASKGSWTDAKTLKYTDVKITAIADIAKDNASKALTGYGLFDKDGNAVKATVTVTPHAAVTKEIKKGKSVNVDITIAFDADQSAAKAATYYLNDATITDKSKAKKGDATELKAPEYKATSDNTGNGGSTGDTTPTVAANQTVTVDSATGTATVKGTNLKDIKAASDIKITAADKSTVDSTKYINTVVPATDGNSVVITFKGLDKTLNGDYTVQLGSIATTVKLTIAIKDGGNTGTDTDLKTITLDGSNSTTTATTFTLKASAKLTQKTLPAEDIASVAVAKGTASADPAAATVTVKTITVADDVITVTIDGTLVNGNALTVTPKAGVFKADTAIQVTVSIK